MATKISIKKIPIPIDVPLEVMEPIIMVDWEIYRQKRLVHTFPFNAKFEESDVSKYAQDELGYPPDIQVARKKK